MVTFALIAGAAVLTLTRPPAPLEFTGRAPTPQSLRGIVYTAHRGGALEAPENSMSGLLAALRNGSAQVIDFDTRMLRDGTVVVLHDAKLDRTTDRRGAVRDLDRRQWRTVTLRPDRSLRGRWPREHPPSVGEVLDRLGGKSVLMLEAKDPRSLPVLAGLIRARRLTHSVFVNSNSPEVALRAHRMGLMAQLWRSAEQMRTDEPKRWRSFVDLLDVDHRGRDQDLRRAVRSGIPRVWAHTVNTPRDRDRALELGCNGIITDAPRLLTSTPVERVAPAAPGK